MNSLEFLSFAGRVATLGAAGARSAVSRAYYGAFHFARETLSELGVTIPRNGTTHAVLPQYLQTTNNTAAKEAAILLSHLHYSRNKCDYDLDDTALDHLSSAQLKVESGHEVVRLLTDFRRECEQSTEIKQDLLQAVAKVDAVRQVRK
ncbi:hypothetical protein [Anatilimnocola floriformis]|uniref:hypothetical protein n=1 Tax=Anatilimnocola floriformis TaxID=2948575 RepID=UPI0020C1E314|nr:hypothetical protein [Anatilimnocola floriformis]